MIMKMVMHIEYGDDDDDDSMGHVLTTYHHLPSQIGVEVGYSKNLPTFLRDFTL